MFVGINPSPDVLYMRFLKDGKIVRVARMAECSCTALYPSENPNIFYGESFHEIDDESPRRRVRRSEIKDRILLSLLQGQPVERILRGYKIFGGDYSLYRGNDFQKRFNSPVFNIEEAEESN
jgi:hypothetical protein